MLRECLIYGLFDPRDGELRYVGKSETGLARRVNEHVMPSYLATPSHKNSWLKGLLSDDLQPVGHVIQRLSTPEELLGAERYWIAFFRLAGCRLTNMTEGGEGFGPRHHSAETRAKMRAAKLGRKHSPEHNAKISAGNMGRTTSVETRAKLSAAKKGKAPHPATIAAARAAKLGSVVPIEARRRQSARMLLWWANKKLNALTTQGDES